MSRVTDEDLDAKVGFGRPIAVKLPGERGPARAGRHWVAHLVRRQPTMVAGGIMLAIFVFISIAAPLLTSYDPVRLNVIARLQPPSLLHVFGTDAYGRDIYSRTLYGGRISLLVGVAVAAFSITLGVMIGMLSGFIRWLDAIVMRIMDGLMAIPGVLLAIAMMTLMRPNIGLVIVALTVTEVPRTVRLVRALVLGIREKPYVEAAISIGTKTPRLLLRHILPNMIAPLTVQATFICASAILGEATLSFLGVGTPPEVPSWGNIIAESRLYVQVAFWTVFFPGMFLGILVLSINIVGDGLRDLYDPRSMRKA
jgi:peptide/nickel transport system permease protein